MTKKPQEALTGSDIVTQHALERFLVESDSTDDPFARAAATEFFLLSRLLDCLLHMITHTDHAGLKAFSGLLLQIARERMNQAELLRRRRNERQAARESGAERLDGVAIDPEEEKQEL